jgi:hypothetical protein
VVASSVSGGGAGTLLAHARASTDLIAAHIAADAHVEPSVSPQDRASASR